ncbi:MAG: AAA family ATPase [Anaerolineales bacterium]|nr:AAA family ATPase [Anaerolineales bacterium]
MALPVIATKVSLPILRQRLVSRRNALGQLSAGLRDGHLLTLVSAPAGYGKTTTIRMWVNEAGCPVAWVTLEKSDNDLKQFLTYVLTALGKAVDDLGQSALEAVESAQEVHVQPALGLLVNELHELDQPVILVLEEYHLIENESVDEAVEFLLNQAVANLRMVIATREDPDLSLTRLRVRNQLTEIRAADLSFSLEEAGEFFSDVMGVNLSNKETEILKNKTEGWAAGLQLAGLSLKENTDTAKFVEAFGGTHRHVLDYLIEETLNSQSEEMREFLRRTSILDQLSASLCEAVTGQRDSRKHLQYLESNNLFLVSLDEERNWYRYHALFGELLKDQLMQVEPDRVDDLHARAADWHEKHGFVQKAVEHAFQISNDSKVSGLIERHAFSTLCQGETAMVMGWFDRLPEAFVRDSAMMCINKAWTLALTYQRARIAEIEQTLQAADLAVNLCCTDQAQRNLVAGHAASIRAYLMQTPNLTTQDAERLIETSQRALRLLPEDEKAIRSVNALNIGYGRLSLADLAAAGEAYERTFEDGIAGRNFFIAIYGAIGLIVLAIIKGELNNALQLCETHIAGFNRLLAGQRFPPIGDLYNLKGSLLLEENRLAEAEQALTQGLSLIRFFRVYGARIRGYSTLARLRSIQGDWAGVLENLKPLQETYPGSALYAEALSHRLALRDPAVNDTALEQAHLWVTQAVGGLDTLPDIDIVDLDSRIRFQTMLSIAHIVTRLAARNPHAYSLPDVHKYLARLEKFAAAHGFSGWLIEIWLVRALMYHVEGKAEEARAQIEYALEASAPRGYFRLFLDESDLLRPLLESTLRHLKDDNLSAYVKRLLDAMPNDSLQSERSLTSAPTSDANLTDRELDVLKLLASGESYNEIGQKLFLSLNTVQFHIKSIYRKLLVNKRMQAVEKAREMKLI